MLDIKDRILTSSMSTRSAIHTTNVKMHYIANAALSKIQIDDNQKCKYIVKIGVEMYANVSKIPNANADYVANPEKLTDNQTNKQTDITDKKII